MTSFSRNFLIHALPFLKHDFRTKFTPEVSAILATSSSFINGSLAPEMVMQLSPEFDDDRGRWRFLPLLHEFSSTLQFVTHLSFHQNADSRSGRVFLPSFFNDLIHKSRYFARQVTHLDISKHCYSELFPHLRHLRALRSLKLHFRLNRQWDQIELVSALEHLDLDELVLDLQASGAHLLFSFSPNILQQIWSKNPMNRLKTFSLDAHFHTFSESGISLKPISDYHPHLSSLSLNVMSKITDLPDLSVMNDLCELDLCLGNNMYKSSTFIRGFFPSTASTPTYYCNSLTKLTLHCPAIDGESVMFLIKNLGSSDAMSHFTMKHFGPSLFPNITRPPYGDCSLYLKEEDYRDEFLDLLISRYPFLVELYLGANKRVTDDHMQLIANNMECLKVLHLPTRFDEMEESRPFTAKSMSWIFDPSSTTSSLETLSLPGAIVFGDNGDSDLSTVFGSSPSSSLVEDRRYCLKNLFGNYASFATVRSFFSFIKHLSTTLEVVSLPQIVMTNEEETTNNSVDVEVPIMMRTLHTILMDWHHVRTHPVHHAIGPLVKATPNLRSLSVSKLRPTTSHDNFFHAFSTREEREELKRECTNLTDIFEAVAGNLVQVVERSYLTIALDQEIAEVTPEAAWAAMAKIPSLRRVDVRDCFGDALPKSDVLFRERDDVATNIGVAIDEYENDYFPSDDGDDDDDDHVEEEPKKSRKKIATTGKKKVVATKKPATKKTTKKPVAKKTAKKSTKKTAAAGKKKKVAPKKATKAKKPVAKKTISTKKKPTAKKTTTKKKPVAKKATTKKTTGDHKKRR